MRSQHTPGPWKWEEGQPKIFANWNGGDYCVASVEESRLGWHEDRIGESRERGANARLIAAAPDLLRVAELLVDWLDEDEGAHKLCDTARAAIAKAEGRS